MKVVRNLRLVLAAAVLVFSQIATQKAVAAPENAGDIIKGIVIDAETGEPGFLLELHNWHENEDRSITVDAALYYNRSGGEFHHLTLTPNGAEYRITGKNSEIIF